MFMSKKLFAAPIAAILVATTLVGSVEAAPRQAGQLEVRSGSLVLNVDYRNGPRHEREHRGDWGRDHRHGWHRMGPREIRRSLRHRGFHRIRIIDERGPVYMVRAIGWRGMRMRLVVDARSGQILRKRPAGRGFGWNHRW